LLADRRASSGSAGYSGPVGRPPARAPRAEFRRRLGARHNGGLTRTHRHECSAMSARFLCLLRGRAGAGRQGLGREASPPAKQHRQRGRPAEHAGERDKADGPQAPLYLDVICLARQRTDLLAGPRATGFSAVVQGPDSNPTLCLSGLKFFRHPALAVGRPRSSCFVAFEGPAPVGGSFRPARFRRRGEHNPAGPS